MVVVMQEGATELQIQAVIDRLIAMSFDVHRSTGVQHTVLGAVGIKAAFDTRDVQLLEGVGEVVRISAPYKLTSRAFRPQGTVVQVGPPGRQVAIGGREVAMMAGPCSVESREQIQQSAEMLAPEGVRILRGGAFKPRTSPYSFQCLGEEGLRLLREAADRQGMLMVSEVMDHTRLPMMLDYVDLLQVGARNMQNYDLLRELGKVHRPVLLKRGPSATIEELLLSAEYILAGGNYQVVLCERGIRTFEGTVKFSGSVADLADETRHAELPWISIPTRHYQPRRLAVSPLRCELSRCRRSPGPTRHYGVLRSDPAVVPHVRFSIRSPAQASTGPAGRHLAPGRGLRHHPGTAALSLACRRPRW